MIKLPSLQSVIDGAIDAAKRFPLVLACAVLGTSIAIFMVHLDYGEQKNYEYLIKWIICCSLGLTLFLSAGLFGESRGFSEPKKWLLYVGGLVLLALYFFTLPEMGDFDRGGEHHVIRYILFNIGLHMLVSFAPFIAKGNINGFWQFNKSLFIRIVLAVIYSGVLYAGLALALLAIDQLFGADINEKLYADLWFVMAGIFNTWFFLSGVPKNFEELETDDEYPKGLKVFSQFVLLPLVTIYLLILYAYMGKIVVQWELPKGWVSYLVIFFSVAGILSLLLIYPVRNKEGNGWINIYSRWFYRAIFPLIILLFVAIGQRVGDYGITENRYFVLLLALWLAGIAIYFLLSRQKNIKVIPISLFLIAFLSSFGPWGAFNVAEKSQLSQLKKVLTNNNMLENGFAIATEQDTLPYEDGQQLVSTIEYLNKLHGAESMQSLFRMNFDSLIEADSGRYHYVENEIFDYLNINASDYSNYYREEAEDGWKRFNFYTDNYKNLYKISGYDYVSQLNLNSNYPEKIDSLGLTFELINDNSELHISENEKLILSIPLYKEIKRMRSHVNESQHSQSLPIEHSMITAENDKIAIKLYLNSISGQLQKNKVKVDYSNGTALLKIKDE